VPRDTVRTCGCHVTRFGPITLRVSTLRWNNTACQESHFRLLYIVVNKLSHAVWRHVGSFTCSLCVQADHELFNDMLHNDKHFLPPESNQHCSLLCIRRRSLQLPILTSALRNNNFLTRILFKDLSYSGHSSLTIQLLAIGL